MTATAMRFLLLDDTEHHLIGRVLDDAADGDDRIRADAWRVLSTLRPGDFIVHGLTDSGHLMALPPSIKLRAWMVARLRVLAEGADRAGRVDGWAPRFFVERLADRIDNDQAPAGEPGSVRVGAEDLRALLAAADVWAATLSPAIRADEREEQDAIYDVTERVGTLAAMVWTEPVR